MQNILENPDFLAYRLRFDTEEIEFIEVPVDLQRRVTWLRRDAFANSSRVVAIPLSQLEKLAKPNQVKPAKPISFIFHTAYCGSTFLSRSLDIPGHSISLREPQLLLDVANAKRMNWQARSANMDYRHLLHLALNLLKRSASNDEHLIIKPVNSVNNIAIETLQASPASRALMMYTDARNFVLSTLKKGEAARQTTRAMFDLLRCDFPHLQNLKLSDAIHMSDLKLILTLWRLQLEQANAVIQQLGNGSIKSVHADSLISHPADVLVAAGEVFSLNLNQSQANKILATTGAADAKDQSQTFSAEKREKTYKILEEFYGDDLEDGFKWLSANNQNMSLAPSLLNPLLDT